MTASNIVFPASTATVSVSIIDSTSWAYNLPCATFFRPPFKGLETFEICCYVFLITHGQGDGARHVLFDMGTRKDWENLVPHTVAHLKKHGTIVETEKHLVDILKGGGTDLSKVEAGIWSHLHWDHTGNISTFPPNTKLVFGPGIKDRFMPGYPTVPDAEFHEADIAGREVVGIEEADFSIQIGGFRAYDYFGDGSFYLLNAPGHSLGHMNALARTTTTCPDDTFMFLAADSAHFGGEFRPTDALPLPSKVDVPGIQPRPCPAEVLLAMHPWSSSPTTRPYLGLDARFPEHLADAEETIRRLQDFDTDERVFVVFAHDLSLYDLLEFYPGGEANAWKERDWKMLGRWRFLSDMQKIAQGTYVSRRK
ncbi:beta-lactamase-like protein [Xylariomycetidae sp. FL2044]|nr:beta-lactamase-like protein [Xylariomycetidae sp. FL2044]